MHADLDQLLSISGGEPVDADVAAHIESCARCRARLADLRRRRTDLHALAVLEPPEGTWAAVCARAEQQHRADARRQRAIFVSAGLAASLAILAAGFAIFSMPHAAPPSVAVHHVQQRAASDRELAQLIEHSNLLEQQLAHLEQAKPDSWVMRASTAATIVDLEDHIAGIDARLDSKVIRPDSSAARALWKSRIDLMRSLLAVRAAHSGVPNLQFL